MAVKRFNVRTCFSSLGLLIPRLILPTSPDYQLGTEPSKYWSLRDSSFRPLDRLYD